ncbi:TRAP transporter small permease [Alkalihalobacillus sp. BA299]|uniref:TRAP transporter small permease n=1 Tax=Alkalihalobacillus sp. BA299 TaxID=2815938 RepID=UPI001ADA820F|nr:TRAP transporter small permease subunit [Alkalihalobacillus sp. BA299]
MLKGIENAYKYFNYIKVIGVWISGIALFLMMFFIVYDVILRNLAGDSIRGGFEIVKNYFMPLVVFPSLAYIYSSGVLPKMDLLIEKFHNKTKMVFIIGMLVIEIVILVLMTQFTWTYAMTGLEREMAFPAAGALYPLYPLFFLIPIAFGMIVIENVFILLKNIKEKVATFQFKYE